MLFEGETNLDYEDQCEIELIIEELSQRIFKLLKLKLKGGRLSNRDERYTNAAANEILIKYKELKKFR